MRIFNIGIREVLLLLVIMLILFGPRQMQENARNIARAIRRFVRSDTWRTFIGVVDDVNTIKDQVVRESGLQEIQDSLRGVSHRIQDIDADLQKENAALTEPGRTNSSEEFSQENNGPEDE